ncbi:hypothetical protein [uncultured Maribacter sp.]|uniref:hypothetical protein n=1 Tax=uncultured Maribacter sp. TaxID=431308 RepID=UPI00260E285C|nr:hypothetical protein [uncultured Maribacter sp.]
MKNQNLVLIIILLGFNFISTAQEEGDYIEFNDRKNVVHGVYLGVSVHLGEMDNKDTFLPSFKVAYVANRKVEVGFVGTFFYSQQNYFNAIEGINEDIIGAYGGLHIEPILFSKSMINLSFPLLVGGGGLGVIDSDFDFENQEAKKSDYRESDAFAVVEPGVNFLFNVNRYLQLEAGIKYRFSSKTNLEPATLKRINGFSAGIGIKVGVFNMGRNRYKKKL